MARSTKPTNKTPRSVKVPPVGKATNVKSASARAAVPTAKAKPGRKVADKSVTATASGRNKVVGAASPASATRVPPSSKGELRAQIEKLETANASLKAKSREANRTAKAAARRIAELETQIEQLQAKAADPVAPSVPEVEQKTRRRGRPPGRKKAIDPGDAVPPGVAVEEAEPMDPEAEAARNALEEHLSGQ